MKKTRFTDEQIVRILRAAETTTIEATARQHGVSEQSIYRWNRQFGQMEVRLCESSGNSGRKTPGSRRS